MKHKFTTQAAEVYEEFKTVMHSMASTAAELQPFNFDALTRKVLACHHEFGTFNRAFYSVVDMQTGDFAWQYGLSAALGATPRNFSLVEFLERIHPDYLPMFRFWAMNINEAAYAMEPGNVTGNYVYHITLPLRREDKSYHWYTQHSFALERDARGHYVRHFNFYDYSGHWFAHNRSPFLPFVTKYNDPGSDLNLRLYALATPRIREFFTHTEQVLLEWYMKGEPSCDKLRMQPHTLHEHNSNILKKTAQVLMTDFKSARDAAMMLLETRLWRLAE